MFVYCECWLKDVELRVDIEIGVNFSYLGFGVVFVNSCLIRGLFNYICENINCCCFISIIVIK